MKTCSIDGCDNPAFARTWCRNHYARWYRTGDPNGADVTKPGEPQSFIDDVAVPYSGDDCLIWPFSRNTYGYAHIWGGKTGKTYRVHRIVCEKAHGKPFDGAHTAHTCGNGHLGCVNPRHLRWSTHQENMTDKVEHGGSTKGARNGNARLTEDKVREIRSLQGKHSQKTIAADFGVSPQIVSLIHRREAWGWLE